MKDAIKADKEAKVINTFPHNIDQGLNSCLAQVLLIDGKTGYINALLDGICVTQFRTGASSGVAFDVLGRKDANSLHKATAIPLDLDSRLR